MASVLIIEDGTGVANANSYATAAEARAYAVLRGVTLPAAADVDPVETMLVLATDYLESLAWIMYPATKTQGLAWPRVDSVWIDLFATPTVDPSQYLMPAKVVAAQCQLVIEQNNGVVLMPTTKGGYDSQFITREKTDVIETNYSEKLGTLNTPTMRIVNSLLRGYLVVGAGAGITAVRM